MLIGNLIVLDEIYFSFSDPFVLLERFDDANVGGNLSFLTRKKQLDQCNTLDALARNGNEGLGCKDRHTCSICRRVFSGLSYLKKHIDNMHLRRLMCDLCPKVYSKMNDIRRHITDIHGNRRFACNVCDYETQEKGNLEKHKLIHGDKVECPVCNKRVSLLREHLRTHNPKEKCPICQKLVSRSNYKPHIRTHSEKKCRNCEEIFENKDDLRR